jgi:hypothetical protein
MKNKFYSLVLILFSFITSMAQQRTVSGRIAKENTNEAVPGVTVTVKGTNTSTATNNQGNYTINVSGNNAVLVFTSVGYKRKEVAVGSNTSLDVSLEEETSTLNDVVVVGYQTVRRRDLTGSSFPLFHPWFEPTVKYVDDFLKKVFFTATYKK